MTDPTHPQQEYIITEDQLVRLIMYELDDAEFEAIVDQIHSRPHSSVQQEAQR